MYSVHNYYNGNFQSFSVLAMANTGSCVDPQIGHPVPRYKALMQVLLLSAHGIETGSKPYVAVFLGSRFKIGDII